MATIELQSEYGYVILVACSSWLLLNWLSLQVMKARDRYDVKFPTMYSEKCPIFNCYQRAHQNTLENYPTFLLFLLVGGLQWPVICALSGLLWVASRFVYARGYYSGDPDRRSKAAFGYIGVLVMFLASLRLAVGLLGWL